ncbi:hypothetical protein [Paraburkholderia sp. BL25I1N1]|uniref:hypothetical protein n=1 Tax=Paraburkholderia sp. BL25I1N1 TaxID=1938804 RepID=UPI0011B1E876|nr:hypothetical protein [Paraburkholderia sp. BL25I1N1]
MRAATMAMLKTTGDAKIADLAVITFIWLTALIGPARAMLEDRVPEMLRALRAQLVMLGEA